MEADPAIEKLARRKVGHVSCRTDDLVADLAAMVGGRGLSGALTMERIGREVEAVTDGLIRLCLVEGEETGAELARLLTLSLSVGGCDILRVRAGELHLRFGTFIRPKASRKRSDRRRP